jgi:hypothetical protein
LPRILSLPWLPMRTNRRQTLEGAHVAAPATARRRCLPPRPRVPMPMSLHQRWRERPRRRARRLTPGRPDGVVHAIVGRLPCPCLRAHSVQKNRTARVRMFQHGCEGRSGSATRVAIGSRTGLNSSSNKIQSHARIGPHHHRADDAGAVLGIVNALRFASTRPMAGPSGIDDACARHRLATTRWSSD